MDIMKPRLVWIEGRCYRFFESDAWSEKDLASTPYVEDSNPQEFGDLSEENCPEDIEIISTHGGKYKHSFYIPSVFFKFIIGPNGINKKKIESETKATIWIPRLGKEGDIIITGLSQMSVVSARHRIDLLVENSRKKIKPTHFLSIPMINEELRKNFENFKEIVLNETAKDCLGIQEGLFQESEKMHLTLGMFVLLDDEDVKTAIEALDECKEKIIRPLLGNTESIQIKVQGLEIMNDDPSNVGVLYGKVSSEDRLLEELVEKIVDFFVEKDLMKRERDKINLHLTVMNSAFLVDRDAKNYQDYKKFDATNILKEHKDYFFGEINLKTIHLCDRGRKNPDGYYFITSQTDLFE